MPLFVSCARKIALQSARDAHPLADRVRVFARERENVGRSARKSRSKKLEAVSPFITDMFVPSIGQGNGVTTVATPFPSQKLPDPGEIDGGRPAVNDDERKIRHMVAGDNLDHGGHLGDEQGEDGGAPCAAAQKSGLVAFEEDPVLICSFCQTGRLMSEDGKVGGEVFAPAHSGNNKKLKLHRAKSIGKTRDDLKLYIFSMSPDYPATGTSRLRFRLIRTAISRMQVPHVESAASRSGSLAGDLEIQSHNTDRPEHC